MTFVGRRLGGLTGLGGLTVALGRTRYDYARDIGDGRGNAILMACVLWLCRTFPEAPLRVQLRRGDTLTAQLDHPLLALLARPNPYYSGVLLWMATLADWMIVGNAYWLKVRSTEGRVVELWWLPSGLVEPRWPDDGSTYLSHYEYRPNNRPVRYEPGDVVHFRYGLDPLNMRKGFSPITALLRELFTDDEAANFSASLLRNLGVPGVILSPEEDVSVQDEDIEQIKAEFEQRFGGDERGRAMVLSAKTRVQVVSFNPQQMDLKVLRRLPEERVSAILGIPAIVVGLGAGLDRSTFANYAEAREAAYESNVIPTQRLLAAELQTQLMDDFSDPKRYLVDFDLSGVRVLQDDQNKLATRQAVLYNAGIVTRAEARQAMGQTPGPEDAGYKFELEPKASPLALPSAPPADAMPPDGMMAPAKALLAAGVKAFTSDAEWYTRAGNDVRDLTATLTPTLAHLFRLTGRRVLARLPASLPASLPAKGRKDEALPVDLAELVPADHAAELERTLSAHQALAIATAADSVAEGLGVSFQLPFDVQRPVLDALATQIVGIAETTRDDVRRIVQAALDEGASIDELKERLRGLFDETYMGRARTIARTESANAYNVGSVLSYRQSELVDQVRVYDGDGCGWASHDDGDQAHGSVRSLDDAHAHPLAHPNCVRAFSPVLKES